MRIVEKPKSKPNMTTDFSVPTLPVPAPPHHPANPSAPEIARRSTAQPMTKIGVPHSRPLVIKVAGFQQEQRLTLPTIVPPRSVALHASAPKDRDREQMVPVVTAPIPLKTDTIPDTPPELVHRTPLLYPRDLPDSALGGTVTLRVFVDDDGHVSRTVVVHSSGLPELDNAAALTVKDWEYEPAFRGGQTAAGTTTERLTFAP